MGLQRYSTTAPSGNWHDRRHDLAIFRQLGSGLFRILHLKLLPNAAIIQRLRGARPNHLDSPRQRDEFHFPQQSAAESFAYTWKHYLDPSTGSGTTFFHLMQAFGVVEGSPLVTLSVAKGNVVIKDYVRGTGGPQCGTIACPNIPMSQYTGLTTSHSISGAFGPAGSLSYTVKDENGRTLISYSVNGSMGAGGGYVKFGIYRQTFVGMTAALAAVGDWVE
ncbi:hypothetical protein B0H10DRAFT_2238139 [Mycena sp. CBHHK59/15]|nr:hypothetical protein B0H10DRAFT_2238139 [Mycena sp. CBHHK59/15]